MKASTIRLQRNALHTALSLALAIGTFGAASTRAYAFDLDPITLSAPVAKTIAHDESSGGQIEQVTVSATIAADREALKYDSGVALLKEKVIEAAQDACRTADPLLDNDDCIFKAVKDTKPQIAAAVARARAS